MVWCKVKWEQNEKREREVVKRKVEKRKQPDNEVSQEKTERQRGKALETVTDIGRESGGSMCEMNK